MKKQLSALLLSLLACSVAIAKETPITQNQVQKYIVKGNNITKCYFPDIWYAKSEQERQQVLSEWQSNSEKVHLVRVYYSLHYPLLADHFGMENATLIFEGQKDLMPYLNKLSQKEKSKVTAKTEKDCKVLWGEVERLIKTYPSMPFAEN